MAEDEDEEDEGRGSYGIPLSAVTAGVAGLGRGDGLLLDLFCPVAVPDPEVDVESGLPTASKIVSPATASLCHPALFPPNISLGLLWLLLLPRS